MQLLENVQFQAHLMNQLNKVTECLIFEQWRILYNLV